MKQCWIYLLILVIRAATVSAETNSQEAAAIMSVASQWETRPQNWVGSDPCGSNWIGVGCNNSHINSTILSNYGLKGTLSGDVQSLVELVVLDLSYNPGLSGQLPSALGALKKLRHLIVVGCSFSGQIPPEIGNMESLIFLGLTSNKFSGQIPASLGKLSNLFWFDITDNQISGPLPVSDGTNPGLDMLTSTKHFHFGKNRLSGELPAKMFHSKMKIVHVLFDNNNFSGKIPSTLGLVTTIAAVRLDWNNLSGVIPSNLNNLTGMSELLLSNNNLNGALPNLTGMNSLTYVDLSNNSFDSASPVPAWFSTLPNLTTLILEYGTIAGQIPSELFSFSPLQTVRLRNNQLNGTLWIGLKSSDQLKLIDLQYNKISNLNNNALHPQILLGGNPVCSQNGLGDAICKTADQNSPPYSTPITNCPKNCPSDQELSPSCECGYPFKGDIYFRLQEISDLTNETYFREIETNLMAAFKDKQLPVESVTLKNPFQNSQNYLHISLAFFPLNKTRFDIKEVLNIGNVFSTQTFKGPSFLGPYYFIAKEYPFLQKSGGRSLNKGVIIGVVAGGVSLLAILVAVLIIVSRQKKKLAKVLQKSNPQGPWDPTKTSGSFPQFTGPRWFSFEELKKCTNNFSDGIGSGGYGTVYKGTLPDGQLVAVKRAEQSSLQGGHEFKTEIGLLSRIHHKNLVSLVGFCSDQGEQMLVYEFHPNRSLRESLSGHSGVHLDWARRLQVALGAARGVAYLHELCDPPIIHRDIKSSNILLDHLLNAKVADFGLSKLLGNDRAGHITSQVKGTVGYLDPEYYMTQQFTAKSDVYSFGVVMLELITSKKPIERGKYIVRHLKMSMDKNKDSYGLEKYVDPSLGPASTLSGFDDFVDLAFRCVQESGDDRPTMTEVVKEIERISQLAGINLNLDSGTPSASFNVEGRARRNPYSNEALSTYTGEFTYPR